MRGLVVWLVSILCWVGINDAYAKYDVGQVREGRYSLSYTVYSPDGMNIAALPVVYMFHGAGGNARTALESYGWKELADKERFIVVAPSVGHVSQRNNRMLMGVLKKLHQEVLAKYRVDIHKTFVTGMSRGGLLAYRAACDQPFPIAAVAVVSASMDYTATCASRQMMPVVHIHSNADAIVPDVGGMGKQNAYYWKPIKEVLEFWRQRNRCGAEMKEGEKGREHVCSTYNNCQKPVQFCVVEGGHQWPGAVTKRLQTLRRFGAHSRDDQIALYHLQEQEKSSLKATSYIWNFFKKQGYW